ncbi:MAG: fused MFS/spermidine synthase [Actinomycetota bacterium]|nr:fused MFS/spermidine synthase [Actinomycetota bacterium]
MPPVAAGLVVFFASAAVLVLEILAGRLLAPYVGVTLQTYTGIIGTVLAGISLGSWYGGKVADRIDPRRLLGPILVAGGVLSLLTGPLVALFGAGLVGGGPVAVVLLAFVGFFAPAAVLSAVTPTVAKLQLDSLGETGSVVGRLSALGAAGAIVGTFVTGFLLVAAAPTRPLIAGVGLALLVAGAVVWWRLRRRVDRAPTGVALVALLAAGLSLSVAGPCDAETVYYCARVVRDEQNPSGRVLWLDTLRHSYVDLRDPERLAFSYAQVFGDVLSTLKPPGTPLDALHIGGGGFTFPRYLARTRPGSDSVVLELDPGIVEIARRDLGLRTGPHLRVRVGDARVGVRRQPDDAYDLVIGDAFGGLAVPWHLTTVEFLSQVHRTLRPDGVYLLNLIDYPPLGFARAEAATLRRVFDHVAVVAPDARLRGRLGGNFVLVASDAPIDTAGIRRAGAARGGDERILSGAALDRFAGGAPVLTDDYAPVDQLLTVPY